MQDLNKIKRGDIVAVKTKLKINGNNWFTGIVTICYPPGNKYNTTNTWKDSSLHINLILPVHPQIDYGSDTTVFYSDIEDIILLEAA